VLQNPPRLVAVDPGTKRVGLAVADPLRLFAQPLGTYSPDEAVEVLRRLHREEGLEAIIVGWPLTLEGEEGEATERVRPYLNRLRNAFPGVSVIEWDERFSSQRAGEALVEAGVPKKARRAKGRVDRAAAALILQEYLDEYAGDSPHDLPPDLG
jgi:putative holliday junction resolvase